MSSKSVVLLWIYCNFSNFQNGRGRYLGIFWNREIFIGYWRWEDQDASACQISSKSVAEILRFFDFSRWRRPPSWIVEFTKFHWLTVARWPRRITFRENWSFRCGDVAIFRIFKMTTAAILDFWNREILLAIRVVRMETHQLAKFCQNRTIGRKDIMIFRFLPRNALLSAVYDVVVCLSVCLSVCVCVCHTPVLYQNG